MNNTFVNFAFAVCTILAIYGLAFLKLDQVKYEATQSNFKEIARHSLITSDTLVPLLAIFNLMALVSQKSTHMFLLILISIPTVFTAPAFTKQVGSGTIQQEFRGVTVTSDLGYVCVGRNVDFMMLYKYNNIGNVVWSFTGICLSNHAYAIENTLDGAQIITGKRAAGCIGAIVPFVMKIDSAGSTIWVKDVTEIGMIGWGIKSLANGNYAITGEDATGRGFVAVISSTGTYVWGTYMCATDCKLLGVAELSNGDLRVAGQTVNAPVSCFYGWVDQTGVTTGHKLIYYAGYSTMCSGIVTIPEGDLVLSGYNNGGGGGLGNYDGFINRIAPDGTVIWGKFVGSTNLDYATGLKVMPSGNLAFSGAKTVSGALNGWMFMMSTSGTYLWGITFNDGFGPQGFAVAITPDNGIAEVGHNSVTTNGWVAFLIVANPPCGPGSYMDPVTSICTKCAIGTYQNLVNQNSCLNCPQGYYQDFIGQSGCKSCAQGSTQNVAGSSSCVACPAGSFQSGVDYINCAACSAGAYQPSTGQTSCIQCEIGKSQLTTGKTYCDLCPIGNYQDVVGQASCKPCSTGFFQDIQGLSSCKPCIAGYYQTSTGMSSCTFCSLGTYSTGGATTCSICPTDWSPAPARDKCLYKGIFNSISDSSPCYSSGSIIKPFTLACRTAYHTNCCQGGTKLASIDCNPGLGIAPSDSLYNNYCSACMFMDFTKCPANGVCWNDLTWTDNSVNPYPSAYSQTCLDLMGAYCGNRLLISPNDAECAPFAGICLSSISTSTYVDWNKIRIAFAKQVPDTLPQCDAIFDKNYSPDMTTATFSCLKSSTNAIDVTITGIKAPLMSYILVNNVLKDACTIGINSSSIQYVAHPVLSLETFMLSGSVPNKCVNLVISSSVLTPYPWPTSVQSWEVTYSDITGITSDILGRLPNYGKVNTPQLTISDVDLVTGKTLQIRVSILNPWGNTIWSPTMSYIVPGTSTGKPQCGICQFTDRLICSNLNDVCWSNYLNYSINATFSTTSCYKAIAGECYKIWNTTGTSNPQCADYIKFYNFTQMRVKPSITGVYYLESGRQIILTFSQPIFRDDFVDCSPLFAQSTLNWLPPAKSGQWLNETTLSVDYNPNKGIMLSMTINSNAIYSDYVYAQEYVDGGTYDIKLPNLHAALMIKGLTIVTECDTIELFGVLLLPSLYPFVFQWNISYDASLYDKKAQTELAAYLDQYRAYSLLRVFLVPNKYVIKGLVMNVTLSAKCATFDKYILVSSVTIRVVENIPKVKYSSKTEYVLELYGNKQNSIAMQIDNKKCIKSNAKIEEYMPVDISFRVWSGNENDNITEHGNVEKRIENLLNSNYNKYKYLTVSASQGFNYYMYYNITVAIRTKGIDMENTDSILVAFKKSPIICMIDSKGSLISISDDVVLSGENSILPESSDETIDWKWRCIKTSSLYARQTCRCPSVNDNELSQVRLVIPKTKLTNLCMYQYSLSISAKSKNNRRTAYNETEFVAFSLDVVPLKGKFIKGSNNIKNDLYVSFNAFGGKQKDVKFQWTLVSLQSVDPNTQTQYFIKNTYMYNFFQSQYKLTPDPNIMIGDQPIPNNLTAKFLTETNKKVLGIDKDSLLPAHKYTFGVTTNYSGMPSFVFVSFTTPQTPRKRQLIITPTNGTGLETEFTFTFVLPLSTDVDEAKYQILRKDCPSDINEPIPITQPFGKSNTYTSKLAPGIKSCNYSVQIIVRAFEYEGSIDNIGVVTVKENEVSVTDAIDDQLKKMKSNGDSIPVDQKITILANVANMKVDDSSSTGKNNARVVVEEISKIDAASGGIIDIIDDVDKVTLLNTTGHIINSLIEKQKPNIDLSLAEQIRNKVDSYLDIIDNKEDGTKIIPVCLTMLNGAAEVGISKGADKSFYAPMQATMDNMTDMKLSDLIPGILPFSANNTKIDFLVQKSDASEFENEVIFATPKGTVINLPPGLNELMLKKVQNYSDLVTLKPIDNNSVAIGIVIESTAFNPYETIKNSTFINASSIANNTSTIADPQMIEDIYEDLAKGKFTDIVNPKEQKMNIVQIEFQPFSIKENGDEIQISDAIVIDQLPKNKTVNVTFQIQDDFSEAINTTIITPIYYVPENYSWTNENCTLAPPNATDKRLNISCKEMGKHSSNASEKAFIITTDVIVNALVLIDKGNYRQLGNFAALKESSSRTAIASSIVACSILAVVMVELVLLKLDIRDLYNEKVSTLLDTYEPKSDIVTKGIFYDIFDFYSQIRRKGFVKLVKETNDQVIPDASSAQSKRELKVKALPTNGFSALSEDEETQLMDAYNLYKQCSLLFTEEEIPKIMAEQLEDYPIVSRLAQLHIDDAMLKRGVSFWILMKNEHPILNIFCKPEVATPRVLKLLTLASALIGELFVTGYFFNTASESSRTDTAEFAANALVYTIASVMLMIPLKIVILIFLKGTPFKDDMTRKEIRTIEGRRPIFQIAGCILASTWLAACSYGIFMYSVAFPQNALNSWMLTFLYSAFSEIVVVSQIKVFIKIVIGFLLVKASHCKFLHSGAGIVLSHIIDLIVKAL